jgi:hypothetical protein
MDAKKWMVFLCLMGIVMTVPAQSIEGNCNPFVAQGTISPAPIPPVELNGTGVISFKVGNTGDDALVWTEGNPGNELVVVVQLSRGLPDVNPLTAENALKAIGGNYARMFSWSYDLQANRFTGRQKETIPGLGVDLVTIAYKVNANSEQPENGFLVTLTPPEYTRISNTLNDDQVSSYTWTEARDFGDAPLSYGLAYHKIQVNPDFLIFLGKKVVGDNVSLESASMAGVGVEVVMSEDPDDDGVLIPDLYRGTIATIDVTASGQGYLNGWIDWNGDGDFLDAGEQVVTNKIVTTGVTKITVNVPEGTPADMFTFARFRLGAMNLTPTGGAQTGEVEDYQVHIMEALPDLAGSVLLDADLLTDGMVDGMGTNENGRLYVNLINQAQVVVASVAVNSDGSFLLVGVSNGSYQLQLTSLQGVVGEAMPLTKLPAGVQFAGEFLGEGAGDDGTPDGLLQVLVEGNATPAGAKLGIVRLPDLTVSITAAPNIMGGKTPFCIYLKVSELNMTASQGPVQVIIPRDSRWSIDGAFDPTLTVLENNTLNNADWRLDASDPDYYIFTTDVAIPAGGFHVVGFKAIYDPGYAKGVYSITSQIIPGSGNEFNKSNNSDSEKIDYFNR